MRYHFLCCTQHPQFETLGEYYPERQRYRQMEEHGLHRLYDFKPDIKQLQLIEFKYGTPVERKAHEYCQQELNKWLKFVGKTREQYLNEQLAKIQESTDASNARADEEYAEWQRQDEAKRQAKLQAYDAQVEAERKARRRAMRYKPKYWLALAWWHTLRPVWRKFDSWVIFTIRIRVDRKFREKWTGVVQVHHAFKEAQQQQFQRWTAESEAQAERTRNLVQARIERESAIIQ